MKLKVGDPITLADRYGDLNHLVVENLNDDTFYTSTWNIKYINEEITWVRGHIPRDSDEAKALFVSRALRFP